MSKVVLHIGTHKTATTTIQDMFWHNAPLLEKHGLIYPRLSHKPTVTGHHGLVFDWARLPPIYKLDDGSLPTLRKLAETYADTDATVFLSSEEFSRGDPKAAVDFSKIRACLAPFDQVEVLVALRPQWQFIQSIYLELSKTRAPKRPPELVGPGIRTGMAEGLWVDYNRLLDQLEKHFIPAEITLLDFETCRRATGGIVGSFLRHLEIDLDTDALEKVNDGASNVSPMVLASWGANILSEPAVAPKWLVDKMQQAFTAEFGAAIKPCLFTREEFKLMAEHFEASNRKLEERRAEVQPGFRLTRADITTLTHFRNTVPAAFWVRLARLLVADRVKNS